MRQTMILAALLVLGCEIPTTYRVETPLCPWPPLPLSDTASALVPLGCPFRADDSTVVVWPFPLERVP